MTVAVNKTINEYADFWRYGIGVNVIPADTRNKTTNIRWKEWQDKPIPEELHNQWKVENAFSKGVAVVAGRVWHRKDKVGFYLVCIDCDNRLATMEVCKGDISKFSKQTLVEQHKDNSEKAHFYLYSPVPLAQKSSTLTNSTNGEIPAFEIKSSGEDGIMFCTPSIHKNGEPYEIIGTSEPFTLTEVAAKEFELHCDNICKKYGIKYLDISNGTSKIPIKQLFKQGFQVAEGNNRHEALLRVMESLISRNKDILSLETIKQLARTRNNELCRPPLDDIEFEEQWKCAIEFIAHNKPSKGQVEDRDTKNKQVKKREDIDYLPELNKKIPNRNYCEFIIDIAKKNN